jgi:O-antigen/teichoic acid export membrane protein
MTNKILTKATSTSIELEKGTSAKHSGYIAIAIMALIAIFSRFIKYAFNVLLARGLADRTDLYGDFSIGLNTVQIIAFILLLGSSMSSIVFLGKYINLKEVKQAISYTRWNLRIVSAISFAFLLFFGFIIIIITGLHLFNIHAFEKHSLVVHMICFAPFFAISSLLSSYLLSNKHPYWYNFFMNGSFYLLGSLMLLANIYFFKISIASKESLWLFSLSLLGIIMGWSVIVAFIKMPNILIPSLSFFIVKLKYDSIKKSKWFQVSSNLIMQQILVGLLITINLYIVEFVAIDETSTGKYSAIITVGTMSYFLGLTLCQLLAPDISTLISKKEKGTLQKLVNNINLGTLLITLAMTIAFCFFSKEILGTFGKNYMDVESPFIIYSVIMFFGAITRFPGIITGFSNNDKYVTKIGTLEILILIVSGIPLTYFFGLTGAAISFGVVIVFDTIAFTKIVREKVKIKPLTFF